VTGSRGTIARVTTAAEIVATSYPPGKPGVFSTEYQDAQNLGSGRYDLFIQVEDISRPVPAWSHVGHANDVTAMGGDLVCAWPARAESKSIDRPTVGLSMLDRQSVLRIPYPAA
jgi:hypothetical protein